MLDVRYSSISQTNKCPVEPVTVFSVHLHLWSGGVEVRAGSSGIIIRESLLTIDCRQSQAAERNGQCDTGTCAAGTEAILHTGNVLRRQCMGLNTVMFIWLDYVYKHAWGVFAYKASFQQPFQQMFFSSSQNFKTNRKHSQPIFRAIQYAQFSAQTPKLKLKLSNP